MILIVSGNIKLNPGAADWNQIKKEDFEVFNNKRLHFMHLNISSLLNEIDDLCHFARSSNAAIIGIMGTKVDKTVYDSEVTVDGYNIVQNGRNRNSGGVACCIRNNICFNRKTCISDNIELELDNEIYVLGGFNINLLF